MSVDLSKVKAGDKVFLRDGSKIIVDDRGGRLPLMVFMTNLTVWKNDGTWADTNPNCGFDIVGVIYSTNRALSRASAMSKASARKAIASLEAKGLLQRKYRTGHATKYHLKITPLQCGGVSKQPFSNTALPRSNRAHHPAVMERQNLPLEPVKNLEGLSLENNEVEYPNDVQKILKNYGIAS